MYMSSIHQRVCTQPAGQRRVPLRVGERESHDAVSEAALLHVQLELQLGEHGSVDVVGAARPARRRKEGVEALDQAPAQVLVLRDAREPQRTGAGRDVRVVQRLRAVAGRSPCAASALE